MTIETGGCAFSANQIPKLEMKTVAVAWIEKVREERQR
jgi:hypothetical protein